VTFLGDVPQKYGPADVAVSGPDRCKLLICEFVRVADRAVPNEAARNSLVARVDGHARRRLRYQSPSKTVLARCTVDHTTFAMIGRKEDGRCQSCGTAPTITQSWTTSVIGWLAGELGLGRRHNSGNLRPAVVHPKVDVKPATWLTRPSIAIASRPAQTGLIRNR
jgi:hypothetical protein